MLFEGTCITGVLNQRLLHMLLLLLVMGSVMVMGNATFQSSERTAQVIEVAGCQLRFLALYSPDLNLIEKLGGGISDDNGDMPVI